MEFVSDTIVSGLQKKGSIWIKIIVQNDTGYFFPRNNYASLHRKRLGILKEMLS